MRGRVRYTSLTYYWYQCANGKDKFSICISQRFHRLSRFDGARSATTTTEMERPGLLAPPAKMPRSPGKSRRSVLAESVDADARLDGRDGVGTLDDAEAMRVLREGVPLRTGISFLMADLGGTLGKQRTTADSTTATISRPSSALSALSSTRPSPAAGATSSDVASSARGRRAWERAEASAARAEERAERHRAAAQRVVSATPHARARTPSIHSLFYCTSLC